MSFVENTNATAQFKIQANFGTSSPSVFEMGASVQECKNNTCLGLGVNIKTRPPAKKEKPLFGFSDEAPKKFYFAEEGEPLYTFEVPKAPKEGSQVLKATPDSKNETIEIEIDPDANPKTKNNYTLTGKRD
jgi:hypothetical protein